MARSPRVEGGPGDQMKQAGHPQTQTRYFRKNPFSSELPKGKSGGHRAVPLERVSLLMGGGRGGAGRWHLRNGMVAAGKQREQRLLLSQQPPGPRMTASPVSATPVQPLGILQAPQAPRPSAGYHWAPRGRGNAGSGGGRVYLYAEDIFCLHPNISVISGDEQEEGRACLGG